MDAHAVLAKKDLVIKEGGFEDYLTAENIRRQHLVWRRSVYCLLPRVARARHDVAEFEEPLLDTDTFEVYPLLQAEVLQLQGGGEDDLS